MNQLLRSLLLFCLPAISAPLFAHTQHVPKSASPDMDTCNTSITISLNETCTATPALDAFLSTPPSSPDLILEIDKIQPFGNGPWVPAVFGPSDVLQNYLFRVRDEATGASCTGQVKVRDALAPVITCPANITVSSLHGYPTPDFLQDSLGMLNVFATATDACGSTVTITQATVFNILQPCETEFSGFLTRTWRARDLSNNSSTCQQMIHLLNPEQEDIVFPSDSVAVCSGGVQPAVTGGPYVVVDGRTYASNSTFGAKFSVGYSDSLGGSCGAGLYRQWLLLNWCTGQESIYTQQIHISDPVPPTLQCPAVFTVNITSVDCAGPVQLPDFDVVTGCSALASGQASWSDGSTIDTLVFSAFPNILVDGTLQDVSPGVAPDFPLGYRSVQYQVTDLCGSSASCSFFVYVTDTSSVCPDTLPGIICRTRTEQLLPIDDVHVTLSAPSVPLNVEHSTDVSGIAVFEPLPPGTEFSFTCVKDTNAANGVSTYDLIVISKHILGIEPLTSPYKMIAADANRSGSITSFDIVTIRSIILGISNSFPNNTSWRFVAADYTFSDPSNPFQDPFGTALSYTAPQLLPVDFIGIKIGDVNDSADPLNLLTIDERDLKTMYFDTENKKVQAGEEFTATFSGSEWTEGFQFTLRSEDLEILDVLPGANMRADQFAVFPGKNVLTAACETAGKARFALRLRSRRSGELRDLLHLNSDFTHAEAYLPGAERHRPEMAALALRFTQMQDQFVLEQNQPNPAVNQTAIVFRLPAASEATLTIFDAAGRAVYAQSGNYEKGEQRLSVDLSALAPGVLYYQMQTKFGCAIRKMTRL